MRVLLAVLLFLMTSHQAFACRPFANPKYEEEQKPFLLKEAAFIGLVEVVKVRRLDGQYAVNLKPIFAYQQDREWVPQTKSAAPLPSEQIWYISGDDSCNRLPVVGDIYEEIVLRSPGMGYIVIGGAKRGLEKADWENLSSKSGLDFKDKKLSGICSETGIKGFTDGGYAGRRLVCND